MRRLLLICALVSVISPLNARADFGAITDSGSFSGQAQSRFLPIYYEDTCTVVISGSASAFKILPEVSSDGGKTFVPVTTIGGGSITANGTYAGALPQLPTSLSNGFTLIQVSRMNGTASFTISCTSSGLPATLRSGSLTLVAADNSATFSVTYSTPFVSTAGPITITPAAYSASDGAVIICRVTSSGVSGFSGICGGGQSGSTITVNYISNGS